MPTLEGIEPSWIQDGWQIQGEQNEARFDDDIPWDITAWTRDRQTQDQQDFNCCTNTGACCCNCDDGACASFCVDGVTEEQCMSGGLPTFTCADVGGTPTFSRGQVCNTRCPWSPDFGGIQCPCLGRCIIGDGCFPINFSTCSFFGGTFEPGEVCSDDSMPGFPCGGNVDGLCCYSMVAIGCIALTQTCNECCTSLGEWDEHISYPLHAYVSTEVGTRFWLSLIDGNLGNTPVEGADWAEVSGCQFIGTNEIGGCCCPCPDPHSDICGDFGGPGCP